MKKSLYHLLLLVLILLGPPLYAQKESIEDPYKGKSEIKEARKAADIGDKYFENFEYYLAAQEYLKAVNADPGYIYGLYQLAESYRLHFNYDKSCQYYKKLIEKDPSAYPLVRYWYALMLKNRGEYEKALDNFELFAEEYVDSNPNAKELKEKAKLDAEGCSFALKELQKPVRNYAFNALKGPVNTGASDYAPVIYKSDTTILLTSAREGTVGNKDFNVLGGKFSDIFSFSKNDDSTWSGEGKEGEFKDLNTQFHDVPGSFTKDKKKFYFTKADYKHVTKEYTEYLNAIYVSEFKGGKWSEPVLLNENINLIGAYNSEPSVSPNGDTLFFVSKRPGGKGMHDIYYSTCNGDDNWGAAVNMSEINTPYIEKTPCYYAKEKTLFFSTNGREGFGGLDIFKATGPNMENIVNIGLPFNSNMDDFYFVLGEEKGYLSSNRKGGSGNDDIYFFNIKSSEAIIAEVSKDSLLAEISRDSAKAANAVSTKVDAINNVIASKNNKGKTSGDYEKTKSISIAGTVRYNDTNEPAANVENRLKDKDGKVIKTTKTNEKGDFRFDNLPIEDYKVEIEDKDPRLTGNVEYIVEDVGVEKSPNEVSKELFENIYFSFDQYKLRPEAKKVLKELVEYYKKHPEIQIEMNASTDSYGSNDYNKKLSKERGEAAMEYLIKQGVDKSALVVNAFGESKPLATNKNAAGRQLNRRVEFYILGGKGYKSKAMTYITDPDATLAQIAESFNMSIEELKELNGINNTDELEAFQPLRVRRVGDNDIIAPVTLALVKTNSESKDPRYRLNQAGPEKYKQNLDLKKGEAFYVVAPKNTLYSISRLFGMEVKQLKKLNELATDTIYIGQRLKVKVSLNPQPINDRHYVVKEGDSMASIAKRFGLTPEQLVNLNSLRGYKLYEHMILKVK